MNIDLQRILNTIQKYTLLEPSDKVLIAFSGGYDSVCLALALKELGYTIALAHLHHGLRDQADADARFCADFAKQLNVPFYMQKADVQKLADQQKISPETAGRNARYAFLESIEGYDKIATGHHRNDLAETVLYNLTRGSGLNGLCGITPKRGNIVRPLLECSRAQIESFVNAYGITPCTDLTNFTSEYTRNRIRLHILPLLEHENQHAIENIGRTAAVLRQDEDYLENEAAKHVTQNKIEIKMLQQLHPALQSRALRLAYAYTNGSVKDFEQKHVEYILNHLKNHGEILNLCHNMVCRAVYGTLIFVKNTIDELHFCCEITPQQAVTVADCTFRLVLSNKPQSNMYFDYDLLQNQALYVRSPQPQDVFYPFGTAGSKPLSKLFIDLKIPKEQRASVPLLATQSTVLCVSDIKRSSFYPATQNTKTYLSLIKE